MTAVREFELEIELKNGQSTKYKLHQEGEDVRAKIKKRTDGQKSEIRDDQAKKEVNRLLTRMNLSEDITSDELIKRALGALDLSMNDVDHLAVEAEFEDGKEIEASSPAKHEKAGSKARATSFHANMAKLAGANAFFRKELYTTDRSQLVLMCVEAGQDIGRETHDTDQVLVFVSGKASYAVGGDQGVLEAGDILVVPAFTVHNVVNTGDAPLKLYTVYTPPEHAPGTLHRTKAEAEAAERAERQAGEK